jgi:hypothetical protein
MGKGKAKHKTSAPATAPVGGGGRPSQTTDKMSPEDIVEKLNAVPTFCLASGDNSLLTLKDLTDESGKRTICAWFTDANQATEMLAQVKAHSPDLADGLHLEITPLGVAYSFACGWAELPTNSDKQVHGSMESNAEGMSNLTELMRKQAVAHGLEAQTWHVPLFSCAELVTPDRTPLFLSQKALAESWLVTGRKLGELDSVKIAMLDLGVIVHQMRTGELDGTNFHFMAERRAVSLVKALTQPETESRAKSVSRAEVPHGVEPSRENAIGAIQRALLAQAIGDVAGDNKDGTAPQPPAFTRDEDEPPPLM